MDIFSSGDFVTLLMLALLYIAIKSTLEIKRLNILLKALDEKLSVFISSKQAPLSLKESELSESDSIATHPQCSKSLEDTKTLAENLSESSDAFLKPRFDIEPMPTILAKDILAPEIDQKEIADSETDQTSLEAKELPSEKSQAIPTFTQRISAHLEKNWLVWIGGLALVFGIGYLGQFVGNRVEFSPGTRVVLASLLSLFFVGIGEWLHRQIQVKRWNVIDIPNKNYIPATFVAAGMTGVYLNIVFTTISYQFFSNAMALSLMALTGLFCLLLSRRFGSLMAVLGLIGGYTAPLWASGVLENVYALMTYISVVTAAALYTQQQIKISWLPACIASGHIGWLGIMSFSVEQEHIALWALLFYPLSTYLLVVVPHQGWTLRTWHKTKAMLPWYHPAGVAALIGLLFIMMAFLIPTTTITPFILTFVPLSMLVLPAIRYGYSSRAAQLSSIVATIIFVFAFYSYLLPKHSPISVELALIGLWTLVLMLRAYWQFRASYRSVFSYFLVVSCTAVMMILTLVLTDSLFPNEFWKVGLASLVGCIGLTWLAQVESRLKTDLIISTHVVLFVLNYLCFDNAVFIALLAVQITVMTIQSMHQRPLVKNTVMIKAAVSFLLVRVSFIPFIVSWQEGVFSKEWMALANCLPAILILGYLLKIMRKKKMLLGDWFEGAFIHLIAILVLLQTQYWLTGSFIVFDKITFTSVSFWLLEALTLTGIYGYRCRFSQSMRHFYQLYSYALLVLAAVCLVLLNTYYMPLLFETVSASAMPIFNGLALGWLVPGIGLLFLAKQGLLPKDIPVRWIYWLGGSLTAFWVAMSIRQFWQNTTMVLTAQMGMAEWLTYSVALIFAGTIWTYLGVIRRSTHHKNYGLIIIGIAITKVFLFDMSYLDGLWRAASFLGLGLALIGLGWLFQTLKTQVPFSRK